MCAVIDIIRSALRAILKRSLFKSGPLSDLTFVASLLEAARSEARAATDPATQRLFSVLWELLETRSERESVTSPLEDPPLPAPFCDLMQFALTYAASAGVTSRHQALRIVQALTQPIADCTGQHAMQTALAPAGVCDTQWLRPIDLWFVVAQYLGSECTPASECILITS
jgi:hypothetical protein